MTYFVICITPHFSNGYLVNGAVFHESDHAGAVECLDNLQSWKGFDPTERVYSIVESVCGVSIDPPCYESMDYLQRALVALSLSQGESARLAEVHKTALQQQERALAAERRIAEYQTEITRLSREGDTLRHSNACLRGKVERLDAELESANGVPARLAELQTANGAATAIVKRLVSDLGGMTLSMLPANGYGAALWSSYSSAVAFLAVRS